MQRLMTCSSEGYQNLQYTPASPSKRAVAVHLQVQHLWPVATLAQPQFCRPATTHARLGENVRGTTGWTVPLDNITASPEACRAQTHAGTRLPLSTAAAALEDRVLADAIVEWSCCS